MKSEEKPIAAFVLSLIAGVLILLVGVVMMVVGTLISFAPFVGIFAGMYYGLLSLFGISLGITIIVCATMLYAQPQHCQIWGALILTLSILSLFGAAGGFGIGFVLGIIGGVLGIIWQPSETPTKPTLHVALSPMRKTNRSP